MDIELFDLTKSDDKRADSSSFSSLLQVMTKEIFFSDYWEKKPFIIKRNKVDYFRNVLSTSALSDVFSSTVFTEGDIRMVNAGNPIPFSAISKEKRGDRNLMLQEYQKGGTFVFENLGRNHLELGKFLSLLESELHLGIRSNVYLTPPTTQGFNVHHDTHDVLILHIEGKKKWKVWDDVIKLPLDCQRYVTKDALVDKANFLGEFDLEPGDMLYLPRGYIHCASANEETSLHITVGLRSYTGRELAKSAVKRVLENNVIFRKGIRLTEEFDQESFKAELLKEIGGIDFQEYLDEMYDVYLMRKFPLALNQLNQQVDKVSLDFDSLCRVNPYVVWKSFDKNDHVLLIFDAKRVKMPSGIDPAIAYMASQENFTPMEVPGLNQESRLILCQRLLKEGFITVVEKAEKDSKELNKEFDESYA